MNREKFTFTLYYTNGWFASISWNKDGNPHCLEMEASPEDFGRSAFAKLLEIVTQ